MQYYLIHNTGIKYLYFKLMFRTIKKMKYKTFSAFFENLNNYTGLRLKKKFMFLGVLYVIPNKNDVLNPIMTFILLNQV